MCKAALTAAVALLPAVCTVISAQLIHVCALSMTTGALQQQAGKLYRQSFETQTNINIGTTSVIHNTYCRYFGWWLWLVVILICLSCCAGGGYYRRRRYYYEEPEPYYENEMVYVAVDQYGRFVQHKLPRSCLNALSNVMLLLM